MSSVDLVHMWKGLAIVFGGFGCLACLPGVGHLLMVGLYVSLPKLFLIHVFMTFAVVANLRFIMWHLPIDV